MNTPQPAGMDRGTRLKLLPLAIGTFAIGSDAFVIAGILPSVAHDLHVSVAAAGQMVTVFALVYAVFAPVLSATLSHLPRQRVLLIALGVFTVANLITAAAPDYAVLAIGRVIAALGAGLYTPNAAAAAALSVAPERRGRALAMVLVGLNVAAVAGVPIGTVIGVYVTWRLSLVFIAFLGVLALVGVGIVLRELPPPFAIALRDRIAILRNGRIVLVLLSSVAGSTAGYAFYTYLAPELSAFGGIPQSHLPVLFVVNGLVGLVGGQLGGRLADKLPIFAVAVTGFLAIAVTMFVAPLLGRTDIGAGVLIALFAITTTVVYVPIQHRLTSLAPKATTEVLALNSSALYLGITLAAAVGGALLASVSARAVPLAAGGFAVVGLLLYGLSHARESARTNAAPTEMPEPTSSSAEDGTH